MAKISNISDTDIKTFCGMDASVDISIFKASAKAFIMGYTGLKSTELDYHEDLTDAYCVLINDMSFNRDYSVNNDKINPCVKAILDLHRRNNVG